MRKRTLVAKAINLGCIAAILTYSIFLFDIPINDDHLVVDHIGNNWVTKPIKSIIPQLITCDKNASNILNCNEWPGTVKGCYDKFGRTERRECTDDDYINKAKSIKALPSKSFFKWRKVYFCKLDNNNYNYTNYLDLDIINSKVVTTKCPTNRPKLCGVIDSQKNKLCLPEDEKCPVNEMLILKNGETPPSKGYKYDEDKFYNMVLFTANGDKDTLPIITNFKISSSQPCGNPSRSNNKYDKYELSKMKDLYGCGPDYINYNEDKRYTKFDTIDLNDHFIDNEIDTTSLTGFNYTYLKFEKTNLYSFGYVGLTIECRNKILQNYKLGTSNFISELQKFSDTVSFSSVIHMIILIVSITVSSLYFLNSFLFYFGSGGRSLKCFIFSNITEIICILIILVCSIIVFASANNVSNIYTYLLGDCLEGSSRRFVLSFSSQISKVHFDSAMLMIFTFTSLICYAIDIFLFFKLEIYNEVSSTYGKIGGFYYSGDTSPMTYSEPALSGDNDMNMSMTTSEAANQYDNSGGMTISIGAHASNTDYGNQNNNINYGMGMTLSVPAMNSNAYSSINN